MIIQNPAQEQDHSLPGPKAAWRGAEHPGGGGGGVHQGGGLHRSAPGAAHRQQGGAQCSMSCFRPIKKVCSSDDVFTLISL